MSISSNRLIPPITSEEINQLFGTSFTDAEDLVLYSGIKMWAKSNLSSRFKAKS